MLVKGATDSKVHWANMRLIWGRQDRGGPHDDPMKLAIWVILTGAWLVKAQWLHLGISVVATGMAASLHAKFERQ